MHNDRGLDVDELIAHTDEAGTVAGFSGGEPVSNDELLQLDCEILVPAAIDRVIDERNAGYIRAGSSSRLPTTR